MWILFAMSYLMSLSLVEAADSAENPLARLSQFETPEQKIAYADSVLKADPDSQYRDNLFAILVSGYYDAGEKDSVMVVGRRVLETVEGRGAHHVQAVMFNVMLESGDRERAYEMVRPVLEGKLDFYRIGAALEIVNRASRLDTATAPVEEILDKVEPHIANFPQFNQRYAAGREWLMERGGDVAGALAIARRRAEEKDGPDEWGMLATAQQRNGLHREALQSYANQLISFYISIGSRIDSSQRRRILDRMLVDVGRSKKEMADSADAVWSASVSRAIARKVDSARNKPRITSVGALLLTDLEVSRDEAERLIASALALGPDEVGLGVLANIATVYLKRGESRRALDLLEPRSTEALPTASSFWLTLGAARESQGNLEGAIRAFTEPMLIRGNLKESRYRQDLERVYAAHHGSLDGVDTYFDSVRVARETLEVGLYDGPRSGRVPLVELFTGAECGPCLAADYACDALAEHFGREDLALLVYHLHIPGPDPMTNPDALARQKFYGVRSTPTVIVDGEKSFRGGGPRMLAKTKFDQYRRAAIEGLAREPDFTLESRVALDQDEAGVQVTVRSDDTPDPGLRLYSALVEDVVHYRGGNSVKEHTFVVRKLLHGPEGVELDLENGQMLVEFEVRPEAVQMELDAYIAAFEENPPGRHRERFKDWRNPPPEMARDALALVVWIQDTETHKVHQAHYTSLFRNDH